MILRVIGVCGLGFTGSGAVTDLLKEYDEILFNNNFNEFSLCYYTDGLLDLKHNLVDCPIRFESSDAALYRFQNLVKKTYGSKHFRKSPYNKKIYLACMRYIEDVTQIKWKGTWGFRLGETRFIKNFLIRVAFKLRRIIGDSFFVKLSSTTMRFSIRPINFIDRTKELIQDILHITSNEKEANKKYYLLDQAFPGDKPQECFVFFEDAKAIVVDRDPRDVYLLSKYDVHADSSWIPTDNVYKFIDYYRIMREHSEYKNENILRIRFEDIIYNYDSTRNKIEEFLNICNHLNKGKFLDVEKSVLNTQLFNKYPDESENIKIIEKELKEWLFDFSKYERVCSKVKTW